MKTKGRTSIVVKMGVVSDGMRVIAGRAKGYKLKAPKGKQTRPTADRVREALFSILAYRVEDAVFLDAFAGSGAVGIEALSRGAYKAVFVDQDWKAVKAIKENLEKTGFLEQSLILKQSLDEAMDFLAAAGEVFDLVFMDPPYARENLASDLLGLDRHGLLAADTLLVVEHSRRQDMPNQVGRLRLKRQARYGDTVLSIYQVFMEEEEQT